MTRLRFGAGDSAWSFTDPTQLGESIDRLRHGQPSAADLLLALAAPADFCSLLEMPADMAVSKLRAVRRAVREKQ